MLLLVHQLEHPLLPVQSSLSFATGSSITPLLVHPSFATDPFTPYRSIHSLPVYQSLPVFIIHHRSITHPGPSLTRATTPPPAVHRRMDPARVAMTCLVANYADYSDLSPTIHHPSSKSKSKSKKKIHNSTCRKTTL